MVIIETLTRAVLFAVLILQDMLLITVLLLTILPLLMVGQFILKVIYIYQNQYFLKIMEALGVQYMQEVIL